LAALRHNFAVLRRRAGPDRAIMAVVKADAYGHGLATVVRALAPFHPGFGVANVREAQVAERHSPPECDIFLLGPVLPQEYPLLGSDRWVIAVSTPEEAVALDAVGRALRVHLCVDTGMGRMGCLPEDAPALADAISRLPGLRLEGVCTHFPSADEDEAFTRDQIARFDALRRQLPLLPEVHLSNSAGLWEFSAGQPFATRVRPGLTLYGISPTGAGQEELIPVLSLRSRVTLVRDLPAGHGISYGRSHVTDRPTRVATVGIGYGDGYPRHLSNRGAEVLVAGCRCPILGRVTMDQIMIDVSEGPRRPVPGDTVTLIGRDGGEHLTAAEVARHAGTIPWAILTGLTGRVERVPVEG
jgi:alanine racemase